MPDPISKSPLLPLQKALYERLRASLSVPVYDFVPEPVRGNYVVLGEAVERPDNVHGAYGSDIQHTFHVVVDRAGFSAALAIVDEISQALDHQPQSLAPEGHSVVSVRRELTQTFRDQDPRYRHALVRYRIVAAQNGGAAG
ncbi:DUF3168 domain-containing protein [Streptomyces sp. G3]|uniref:DUF3168 domain-containing protein n=1 Tax=unclassified Streptomyces TaxID=2593676 RepID=UPI00202F63CB|nr:DUF3168 domain-containing protein [Streptomyces sp. G3]MCM1941773.1 DUF3168 domain-containing protein [Streptomyces sp. G3]